MSDKDKDIDPADDLRGSEEAPGEPSDREVDGSEREHDSEASSSGADGSEREDDSEAEVPSEEEFFQEPWNVSDPLADAEDAIDPELLALAEERPPTRWYRPIVMIVVCVLIVVMMVWFRADVMYFFADTEVVSLGEAHDVRFSSEWENRFVEMEGIPLAPRNENPSPQCGSNQGFPTYQRRFFCRGHMSAIPVMGRPGHDLIIQRFMVRQLRIHYQVPDGRDEDETRQLVEAAARRVGSVHDVRPAQQGELGRLIVDVEGTSGRTDITAVGNSIRFQVEASVPGIRHVRVERVRREVPGHYRGRIVRLSSLGSRFAAVADYLNECTSYPVGSDAWVILDGSEAGEGLFDSMGICYGQSPRQYWPYLVLYLILVSIFALNILLLVRFFRGLRKE